MITYDYIKELIEVRSGIDVTVKSPLLKNRTYKKIFIILADEFAPQFGYEHEMGEYLKINPNTVVVTLMNRVQIREQVTFDVIMLDEIREILIGKLRADNLAKKEIIDFIVNLDEVETLRVFELMRNIQISA